MLFQDVGYDFDKASFLADIEGKEIQGIERRVYGHRREEIKCWISGNAILIMNVSASLVQAVKSFDNGAIKYNGVGDGFGWEFLDDWNEHGTSPLAPLLKERGIGDLRIRFSCGCAGGPVFPGR